MKYWFFLSVWSFIWLAVLCILVAVQGYKHHHENFQSDDDIKLLHLVLYSETDEYTKMYKITREYYLKYPNVRTVYYCFRPNIAQTTLDGDILAIPGTETLIPGIIEKTIRAMEYFRPSFSDYKYIIRSNISTVVNFKLLCSELKHATFDYGGGLIWHHSNTPFVSGTSIIMSPTFAEHVIVNEDKINKQTIDDVALGDYFGSAFGGKTQPQLVRDSDTFMFVTGHLPNEQPIDFDKVIFYRNRNGSRYDDASNMKYIIDHI